MAVTYSNTAKDARLTAVVTTLGAGAKLKLLTAADAVLATFTLATTAGTASAGVLTFADNNGGTAGILNTTATASGVAAKAIYTTSADVTVISGLTVGTSGTDLIIDNTNIASGQSITVNSATITHAA